MSEQDVINGLETVFHEVFDDEEISVSRELTANDVAEWDSFNHVRLIVAAEEHFNVTFSTGEVADLRNVGELIDLISKHLSND